MSILQGGISTLVSGFCARRPAYREYHILSITLSGSGEYLMENGQKIITKEQDLYFSHADGQGHIHRPVGKVPWKLIWLQISKENSWLVPPSQDWALRTTPYANRLRYYLEDMFAEELENASERSTIQQLYAQLFFLTLQRELQENSDPGLLRYKQSFSKLWMQVSASLEQRWSLDDLCKEVDLSPAHFSRLCHVFYRKSPGMKVRELKMEHARSLLQNIDCPISQVAEVIGYESTSTFSTAFSHYFHLSPSDFRRSL